ncbi:ABC transporter ATP-binding protein [Bosea sp. (in: a-proteobacteria)]|uniref:ABC transporter ATP-binding protein n=1 Tax=Bosea sp. (in: a-proteobacteria) TaxID=1871050 RepID=UPI0027331E04|nr:ABC transporter ATP-binding protein [Bosea sp. (in: a-proteobacteria)]MDP3410256.1 ABC transporter ATP-binding protein [Bosea sp. (in: a-proteobacteria)]
MRKASPGSVRRAFQPWNDPAAQPLVEFRAVTKRFGGVTAVADVSLSLYPREFFALLGPSGCGKTTLMRMLAGFETPDEGQILLDGVDITAVPPHLRPVNMMFQSYALFPHLSVADNIGYGLKREGLPRAEIDRRVAEMLALVKLDGLGKRRPDQLSGGQRQRVALARALAKRPKLLLLDEPMAALDRKLREATQFELMDIQSELGTTFMVVTHDQDEAMTMADRMAVMDHGRLVQIAPPDVIYEAPVSRHVAEFVGDINILKGRVESVNGDLVSVTTPLAGRVELDEEAPALSPGAPVLVGLRPEKIALSHDEPAQAANKVRGEIWDIGYLGDMTMVQVMIGGDDGQLLKVSLTNRSRRIERPFAWEDTVWLSWDVEAGLVLKP